METERVRIVKYGKQVELEDTIVENKMRKLYMNTQILVFALS